MYFPLRKPIPRRPIADGEEETPRRLTPKGARSWTRAESTVGVTASSSISHAPRAASR